MSSSSSPINIPLLIGGFTAVGILAVGAYQVPRILKARARNQQQGCNPSMAQSSFNRRPPIPSCQGVPSLSLRDIELDTIRVLHITKPHQDSGTQVEEQEADEVWEMGKGV